MRYRDRRQATAYLRENGIPCGDHFLAHLAVDGTGPEFRYSGRHPIYTEIALDEWLEARLSAPVRSPSQLLNTLSEEKLGPPTREARHQTTTTRRPGRPRLKNKATEPDVFEPDAPA